MKKKIASLLVIAAMLTAVPAFAAAPEAAAGQPCQDLRQLSDSDGWYCGGRHGRGGPCCGRHDGYCWDNQQQ